MRQVHDNNERLSNIINLQTAMLYQMCELTADLISIWHRTAPVTTASMTTPPTAHAEEFTLILQQDTNHRNYSEGPANSHEPASIAALSL